MKTPKIHISFQKLSKDAKAGYLYLSSTIPGTKKVSKKSLGYKIEEKHWDKSKSQVKPSHPESDFINSDINDTKATIIKSFQLDKLNRKNITENSIRSAINGEKKSDFVAFFRQYIVYISNERKSKTSENKKFSENNIKKWKAILNRLADYSEQVPFSDIDVAWMEKYEAWNARTLDKDTSLPVHMARTKQVLKKASDKGLFDMSEINGYRVPVYKNPEREYITVTDIDEIWNKLHKFESDRLQLVTACYFMVECLSGLRFSDWHRFTIEKLIDKDRIKVAAKKNGEPVYFPYHKSPRLKRVIDYITANKVVCNYSEPHVNATLKDIAKECKIKVKLTTHVGRHTFATLMLEHGYSEAIIAEWMAVSEKTVKIYAKRIRTAANKEYENLGGL